MRFDVPAHQPQSHMPAPAPQLKKSRRPRLPKPSSKATAIIVASCAVIVLALAGLSGYLYWQNSKLKKEKASYQTTEDAQKLVESTIQKVGKLYELPNDEKPTLASVNDVSQIKDQPFFKNAKNGDRILVYAKAKIAILYRESEDKIINVGPVSTEGAPEQKADQAEQPKQ